ncbi:hypothetical protein ACOJR9_00405 [Alteromonas sp. A081]|uniref:hypothetical protein n=1 Tax=Alteromonas sp. A081 TaxID=3410269 RepID=UPI003B987F20
MKTPSIRRLVESFSRISYRTFLIVMLLVATSPFSYAADLKVMAHESVSISQLNRSELRQIFTGHRQYWANGKKITVFVLQDNDELHKQFCRDILQMFPYQLSRLWDQLTYSGQGVTPVRVSSYQALIEALESTEGAIGYGDKNDIVKLRRIEVEEK